MVVPAIVSALSLSGRAGELTERGAAAGQLAENKLNEMLVADAWQSAGTSASGDCGPDWPGYRWEMTQTPWTGGGSAGGAASTASTPAPTGGTANATSTSATTGTGNIGNATVTELKVEVFFKVRGTERSVTLSTLVNSLASSTGTTTGTGTSTGGSTP